MSLVLSCTVATVGVGVHTHGGGRIRLEKVYATSRCARFFSGFPNSFALQNCDTVFVYMKETNKYRARMVYTFFIGGKHPI